MTLNIFPSGVSASFLQLNRQIPDGYRIIVKKRREGDAPPAGCEYSLSFAFCPCSQEQKQDEKPDDVLPPEIQDDRSGHGKRTSDDPLDAESTPGVVVMNMAMKPSS